MKDFSITIRILHRALFLIDNQEMTVQELRKLLIKIDNQDEELTEDEFCQLLFENGIQLTYKPVQPNG